MADDEVDNKDLTPLERKNAQERRIILEGPNDPDNFEMPDGRTLSDTRREMYEKQVDEGLEAERIHTERMREQSIASDPLYSRDATLEPGVAGSVTLIPAPLKEGEGGTLPIGNVPSAPFVTKETPQKASGEVSSGLPSRPDGV